MSGTEPETSDPAGRLGRPLDGVVPTRPHPASDDDAIPSEVLLDGRTEVRIRHRGEIYRLSLTRAGKLILHK
jgi:hemin uptake protein HemP